MLTTRRPIRSALVLAAVILAVAGGVGFVQAAAAIPDNGVLHACYPSNAQPLKPVFLTPTNVCPSGFTPVDINQTGPQGPAGPTGLTGLTGPQGPACLPSNPACKGPAGAAGPAGVSGYEVVFSGDIVIEAFETRDFFVDCLSGKTAISAGFGFLGGQSAVEFVGSVPTGQSWGFRVDNPAAVSQFARASIVCAFTS